MRLRSIRLFLVAVATSSLAACAVDSESGEDVDEVGEVEAGDPAAVEYVGARVLAAVERSNRGVVRFLASDGSDGVGCDELVPADGVAHAASSAADARTCLELYLDLTERTAPVPAELAATSSSDAIDQRLAARAIVDVVAAPLRSAELQTFGGDQETSAHSCDGDSGTATHFADNHCSSSGGSGVIEYCDSGQWFDLIRTTAGGKRKNSFAEILSCTALADVIHEYWNGTSWPNSYSITNIPGDFYHWSRWEGAAKWERRIHTYRVPASGFVRAHTIFYN